MEAVEQVFGAGATFAIVGRRRVPRIRMCGRTAVAEASSERCERTNRRRNVFLKRSVGWTNRVMPASRS